MSTRSGRTRDESDTITTGDGREITHHDTDDERHHRIETLRQLRNALAVDVDPWDLPGLAHWVHTGRELVHRDINHDPAVSPDAARWTPGDDQ